VKAREARLAAQKTSLEADLAAMDAFGHVDEFKAALKGLDAKCGEFPPGAERWVQIEDGWLPMMAVDHWLLWHLPQPGSKVPLAIDVDVAMHPFPAVVDLSDQLHAHDVDLLIVVFPSRVQLQPDLVLPGLGELKPETFRGMSAATVKFLLALNAKGVETLDLAPPFAAARHVEAKDGVNGDLYLARNKHWTPRAAELAAKLVAERIRAMPWFTEGELQEGRDFELERRVAPFTSTAGGQSPDRTPEKLELIMVRQLTKANEAVERRSPIVVLSDSFAKFYCEEGQDSSFVDHLRRFTGWPVDKILPMGGAELRCREILAQRGDKLRGKKLVIWLLQEDNLRPCPGFKKVDLFADRESKSDKREKKAEKDDK
jgi:hypothetical protein